MEARPGVTEVIRRVVYGGDATQARSAGELLSWAAIQSVEW